MIRLKEALRFLVVMFLVSGLNSSSHCFKDYRQNVTYFPVLPGFGWDNLRNVEVSRVVEFNYSRCQLSNDGLHLLPNGIDTIPLKQSKLDLFSEIFHSYTDFSSVTARSVNEDAGFNFPGIRISGSFSDSFINSKETQVKEKSKVVRSQLRFIKYKAKLQPDASLSSAFKVALLSIARHVLYNRTDMARYESELLVRDFGTHVITSINAGAALVQEDHIDSAYASNDTLKRDILLGASMSMRQTTGIGLDYDTTLVKTYEENRLNSYVKAYGGSMFLSKTQNNPWTSNLEDNLVAIDREGEAMYNFVNILTLPSVPSTILYDVTAYIEKAVTSYYQYNTYPGCTDVDDPNFNVQTNVDDGSCATPRKNVSFGGVYQMCDVESTDAGDLCSEYKQANIRTGGFSCPIEYQSKLVYSAQFSKTSSKRVCKKCYAFFECCDDEPVKSKASLKSFWCSSVKPDSKQYYFAGTYSSVIDNIFTKAKSCPKDSYSRLIGNDINICLSETTSELAVNFGGIFSCKSGNPLASTKNNKDPKSCPAGFNPQLAGFINDCYINYCIATGDLPSVMLPVIRRPPYSPKIKVYPKDTDGDDVVYDQKKQMWLSELESRELKETDAVVSLTAEEAAVIAIFVTILFIILIALFAYFYRKKGRSYPMQRNTRNGHTNSGQEDAV